jgi:hypothetical protein
VIYFLPQSTISGKESCRINIGVERAKILAHALCSHPIAGSTKFNTFEHRSLRIFQNVSIARSLAKQFASKLIYKILRREITLQAFSGLAQSADHSQLRKPPYSFYLMIKLCTPYQKLALSMPNFENCFFKHFESVSDLYSGPKKPKTLVFPLLNGPRFKSP